MFQGRKENKIQLWIVVALERNKTWFNLQSSLRMEKKDAKTKLLNTQTRTEFFTHQLCLFFNKAGDPYRKLSDPNTLTRPLMKYLGDRVDKHEAKLLREIRERINDLTKVFMEMKNVRIAFSTGDQYDRFLLSLRLELPKRKVRT